MTKEALIALGLTEEQADKVMKDIGSGFVTKAQFDAVSAELKTTRSAVSQRDKQLDALKQSGADAAALQSQIAQLQADNAEKDAAHAAEIKQIRLDNAVDKALAEARAINPATVKPLLAGFLEKADLDDDGTVRGLADEIGKLAKTEGTSFLFKAADVPAPSVSGASPAGSGTVAPNSKSGAYEARLADARKSGNAAQVVAIKREAAADGVALF